MKKLNIECNVKEKDIYLKYRDLKQSGSKSDANAGRESSKINKKYKQKLL